jgi:acetolactate synthase-1/3 small subunit
MSPAILSKPTLRTFVATVEDVPGVLNRVASLFRRRAFNIVSLTVGRSEQPGVSRLTVVVEADDATAHRLEANLYKLVNVLGVQELDGSEAVERDLALIKVKADAASRATVVQLCELFRARVIDVGATALVVEITGTRDKIDGLRNVLGEHGILEMVRTGAVAMTRGEPDSPNNPKQNAPADGASTHH